MRTALALLCIFTASLMLTGCGSSKIMVINASRIYQESEAGKAGLAYLEQVEKDVKGKAETAQRVAESMPDNEAMPASLQQFFITCQETMNNAQQEAVNSVQDLINRSITQYRERNHATVIMQNDAVISMDPAVDVTDAVIAEMNKSAISFAPVNIVDFTPPPAPARPAPAPAPTPKKARPAAPAKN
ncbi:MAG: OmpH family outer membrane protein [Deltaproteobacteria bacterium]|jgi:outer membrane protein|nr:OmpH family outer membrane protein [Deltaproteobacteria bacterium]